MQEMHRSLTCVICGDKKKAKELSFFVNIADLFSMSNKVKYCCKRGNKKVLSFLSRCFVGRPDIQ